MSYIETNLPIRCDADNCAAVVEIPLVKLGRGGWLWFSTFDQIDRKLAELGWTKLKEHNRHLCPECARAERYSDAT